MSSTMTTAVIRMPFDMAMADFMSQRQFYHRAQSLLDERNDLIETLRKIAASGEECTSGDRHARCVQLANEMLNKYDD